MVLSIDSRGDLSKQFDDTLTVQDKIRLALNEFGAKYIPITIDEFATQLHLPYNSVYQALHRLRGYGEIDFDKSEAEGDRDKIIGIKVIKLEPSNRTYRRAASRRSGRPQTIRPALRSVNTVDTVDGIPVLPKVTEYLTQKLTIEEMKQRAKEAGLEPSVIAFEPDALGEESVTLLKLYTDLLTRHNALVEEHRMQGFDLEAEKRNNEALKRKIRQETDEELRQHARAN